METFGHDGINADRKEALYNSIVVNINSISIPVSTIASLLRIIADIGDERLKLAKNNLIGVFLRYQNPQEQGSTNVQTIFGLTAIKIGGLAGKDSPVDSVLILGDYTSVLDPEIEQTIYPDPQSLLNMRSRIEAMKNYRPPNIKSSLFPENILLERYPDKYKLIVYGNDASNSMMPRRLEELLRYVS